MKDGIHDDDIAKQRDVHAAEEDLQANPIKDDPNKRLDDTRHQPKDDRKQLQHLRALVCRQRDVHQLHERTRPGTDPTVATDGKDIEQRILPAVPTPRPADLTARLAQVASDRFGDLAGELQYINA